MCKSSPSTEKIQQWWVTAQAKGADYIRILDPKRRNRYYALEACKHKQKARISQISLATTDKTLAVNEKRRLLATQDSSDPEAVIQQYYQSQLEEAEVCEKNSKYERRRIARTKTAKTNYSRLHAHLQPFCEQYSIRNVCELYKREIVGAYLSYLRKTVPVRSTAKAIVKTTKAMLRWYDSFQAKALINQEYFEAIARYGSKLGYEKEPEKPFLSEDQCRQILATETSDIELRATIIAHLVCGLRDMEVQGLRWRDLNEKAGNILVSEAKGSIPRYTQYPTIMQDAFAAIRRSRTHHLFPSDYIFSESSYGVRNSKIKFFLRAVVGVTGKDFSSNCLRRSGADLIDTEYPGMGDRQLGHSANSRTTENHYHNHHNFRAVNRFWDGIWEDIKSKGLHLINLSDVQIDLIRISA